MEGKMIFAFLLNWSFLERKVRFRRVKNLGKGPADRSRSQIRAVWL